ncbi:farnesol dehydrogenase-like isoform X1 [Hylaeus anthracinus]|nr:farnesol dehydrogenase-like isoform X1 [Hylaeus anthracinus]
MEFWAGKVAIVTGASAGIGTATSKALVGHGVKVVGLARRMDKLQELAQELGKDKFYPLQCDVRKEEDIIKVFKWIEKTFGGASILVNNAGVISLSSVTGKKTATEEYRKVVETNLIAPAIFAREFSQSIKKRNVPGHIVNINSILGHYADTFTIPIGLYAPSKYGLTALGTGLRHEFIISKLKIKVTSVSPGFVMTEMVGPVPKHVLDNMPILQDKDIANAVIYALGTPQGVEIVEVTVMAQNEIIGVPAAMKRQYIGSK